MAATDSNQEYNQNEIKTFLKKVGKKDLNTVFHYIQKLEGKIKDWEYEYGEYKETIEDKEFYEQFEKLPGTTRPQIREKIVMLINRIAEKLGDIVEDFQENEEMFFGPVFFTKFFDHGRLWCFQEKLQLDDMKLSYREKKMIAKELSFYAYLERKWTGN